MEELIERLHEEGCSCVIANKEIRIFRQRGVADLYYLLKHEATFLKGAAIADKVIGKAAAALMVLGGIKTVYADVISQPALTLLQKYHTDVSFAKVVPHIINRDRSGWCPLETRTFQAETAEEILPIIEDFIQNNAKK